MKTTGNRTLTALIATMTAFGALTSALAGEKTVDNTSFDLAAGYHWLSPKRSADWSSASGIELQGRFWESEHIGFALVGAYDTWKAKTVVFEEETPTSYAYTSIMGDATVTSLGASLLYRSSSSGEVKLVMDIGLRYAMIYSAIYSEAAYDGRGGPNYLYDKIQIENTVLFTIRAGLEFELSDNVSLTVGAGYQADLNKPQETFAGESLGETSMDAVSYGVLLSCKF